MTKDEADLWADRLAHLSPKSKIKVNQVWGIVIEGPMAPYPIVVASVREAQEIQRQAVAEIHGTIRPGSEN